MQSSNRFVILINRISDNSRSLLIVMILLIVLVVLQIDAFETYGVYSVQKLLK